MNSLPAPARQAVNILDESDPNSLIHILPVGLKKDVQRAAVQNSELFTMDEEEFLAHMAEQKIFFNTTDDLLRAQFWLEYHQTRAKQEKMMSVTNIFAGVCSEDFFYNHYTKKNLKVAWLCTVPLMYHKILEAHLQQLARNMATVIRQPLIDPVTGRFDKGVAQLQVGLLKMIHVTVHGTPTQRIEQKSMNLNVTRLEGNAIHGVIESQSEESLSERIKKLEAMEREASHVPRLAEWQTMPVTGIDVKKADE